MTSLTFQVLEGVDKGRVYRELATPVTIGREEGNMVRLNDERVSRFHAKIQQDQGDLILTDLESTNGTRVNGNVVQVRRLRVGDCVNVGRSVLIFGSNEEINARLAALSVRGTGPVGVSTGSNVGMSLSIKGQPTMQAHAMESMLNEANLELDINVNDQVPNPKDGLFVGNRALPPLPMNLSLSQAARVTEILDFLHRCLARGTENVRGNEDGSQMALDYSSWQRVLAVQMLLARYLRAVADPDSARDA